MSVLELGAVEEKVIINGTIENITDNWGIAEDHNIFEVSLVKGYKYIFDIESTSIYRNSFGIDQYNEINFKIFNPLKSWSPMTVSDGLVIEENLSGITTVSFIAKETGTYKLDIYATAGYSNTTEFGESSRIDTPYILTAIDMGQTDIYSNDISEAFEVILDKTNGEGFAYNEISASSYSAVDDQDWFRFTPDSTKEYIISVVTTDGTYKRVDINMGWDRFYDIGAGKSDNFTEQWQIAPTNNDEITINVTGSKGEYILKIEEAIIDIGDSIATDTMETLSLGTTYETSKFNYRDRDFYKVDNLEVGEMYQITIDSDAFSGSGHNYTIRTSAIPDTEGSAAGDYAISWGDRYDGYGDNYADGRKFYITATDTSELYFSFLDTRYTSNFGEGVLDYSVKVEKLVNELASSVDEIDAQVDTDKITLQEGVNFTYTGLAGKNDYVAVNLDRAGIYVFEYDYDSPYDPNNSPINLFKVTDLETKSTVASAYNSGLSTTASIVAGTTVSGVFVKDTATLSTVGTVPNGFVLNDDGTYSFDTSSYDIPLLESENLVIPIKVEEENGDISYANLRFTINSQTYYSMVITNVEVGTNISGTMDFANAGDTATISIADGDVPTGFTWSENGDYSFDTSSYSALDNTQYLTIPVTVTEDGVESQRTFKVNVHSETENFEGVEYSYVDGKMSFSVSDEIGSEATPGLYYLEFRNETGEYNVVYTHQEFDDTLDGGNDVASATAIDIGTSYTHSIGSSDDVDYFKLDLKAGVTYKVDLTSEMLESNIIPIFRDSNSQKIYNQDEISAILKEVFEKVYVVSGEHMQRTLDFFQSYNIDDFFGYLNKINASADAYMLLLPQERENLILHFELLNALSTATYAIDSDDDFDFNLWFTQITDSGDLIKSSLTLENVDDSLKKSTYDGKWLDTFTQDSLPPVLARVTQDLQTYSTQLKENLIEERGITQEQLTANLVNVIDTSNVFSQTDFETMNTELSNIQNIFWSIPHPDGGSPEEEPPTTDILTQLIGSLNTIANDDYVDVGIQEYSFLEMQIVGNEMMMIPSIAGQIINMTYIVDSSITIDTMNVWYFPDPPSVTISDGTNSISIDAADIDTTEGMKISAESAGSLTDFLTDTPITITMTGLDYGDNPVERVQTIYKISTEKQNEIDSAVSDATTAFNALDVDAIIASEITAITNLLPETNPTVKESIIALISLERLKQTLEWELSTPIQFTADQQNIVDDIRVDLSIDNLNAYLTTIIDTDYSSYSGIDILNIMPDIKLIEYNLWTIFQGEDSSSVSAKITEAKSAISDVFSITQLNEVYTYFETLSADTSLTFDDAQTAKTLLSAFKYDILAKHDPSSEAGNTEVIPYVDNYIADLLSTKNADDTLSIEEEIAILRLLVEETYGINNLYFSQDGSTFVVNEDATYTLGFQLAEGGLLVGTVYLNGEYSFEVQSMESMDGGDTIADATDYDEVDNNDGVFDGNIRGMYNSAFDIDMYKLELVSGHRYEIKLTNDSMYDTIKFYTENGEIVNYPIASKSWKSSGNETIYDFNPLVTQTYYMETSSSSYKNGGTYNVEIVDFSNSDLISGSLEKAANYTDVIFDPSVAQEAFKMDFAQDKDYYEIDTTPGNYYTIDLTSTTMKFIDIKVFTSDGNEVLSDIYYKNKYKTNVEDIKTDIPYLITDWDNSSVVKLDLYTAGGGESTGDKYYVEVSNSTEIGSYKLDVTLNETMDDYGSDSQTIASFIKYDGKKTAEVGDTLNGKVLESTDIKDGLVTVAVGDDFNGTILTNTDITYDNTIEGRFEKRNDKDWFQYDWDKAVYELVIDAPTVDVVEFGYKYQYGTDVYDLDSSFVNIIRDYQAERDDDSFTAQHYIVAFKYNLDDTIALSLQNTYGAGDYNLSINKIADIDDSVKYIIFDETSEFTNSTDQIQYQTDTSQYFLYAKENGAYQIELSADETNKLALGQLLITVTDNDGNTQELLKEWSPTDVMSRAIFIAEDEQKYTIEIKTADNSKSGDFTFNIAELDMGGDIGSSLKNHGDFDTLATNGVVSGTLEMAIDKDWYRYNFEADKQYLISFDATTVGAENGLVYIYDSEGNIYKQNQVWDTNDTLSSSDKTILFNPIESGEFYLSVSDSAVGDYTLKVEEYVDTTDIVASLSTETLVVVDSTEVVTSFIDNKDDKDWIKVTLEADKIYKVETTASGDKMPIPVELLVNGIYNSSNELIAGTVSNNNVEYIKPEISGDYFIEISGKNNTLGFYDIRVTSDTTTDAVTSDTSTDQTMVIGTTYEGEIDYTFDKDWVKITLDAGKKYDISMSGDSLEDSHITGIYDAIGTTLSLSNNDADSFTLDSKVTLDLTNETENLDYFIEASGYGDLKGTYEIAVEESTTQTEENILDETLDNDANNTITTAISGVFGRYQFANIDYATDTDFFEFDFKAGVTYEINMYGADSNLGTLSNSLIQSIRDSDGVEIAGYSNARGGFGNDALLTFTAESSGKYYVETASQYQTTGSFKLSVKEQDDNLQDVQGVDGGSHTLMVYLGGDNNLEKYMIDDLIEMQFGTLPDNWNVTFLIDRAEGYYAGHGDWTDTRQGVVSFVDRTVDDRPFSDIRSNMESLGELNTGDGQTLTDFINWSAKIAEADSYSLVLSNHGGGVPGSVWDDASGHDNLQIAELTAAIEASTVHQDALLENDKGFEMIGFDTCLQGVLDQQYALKSVTDVVLASQEVSWSNFWDYKEWFDSISAIHSTNGGVVTGELMASSMVDLMAQHNGYGKDMTYSAVNTQSLDAVVTAVTNMNNLFSNISANDKQLIQVGTQSVVIFSQESQIDLGGFASMLDSLDIGGVDSDLDLAAQAVVTAVDNAVIANATNMSGNGGDASGIAIQYGYGYSNDEYMQTMELAGIMNMAYFFEVV